MHPLYLQHLLSFLCSFVIVCLAFDVILVLLAIHTLMDGLTEKAIDVATGWTPVLIHLHVHKEDREHKDIHGSRIHHIVQYDS